MFRSSSKNRFRKGAKLASCGPGLKSAPRGSKSTTFGKGFFQLLNLQKIAMNPMGTFRFTHSISDIPMTPICSLRSFRNWRLGCCELHVDTDFEIYGSSIGVCIYVIQSNPIQSNPFQCNPIQSINHSLIQSINQIKSNQSTNPLIQ